jgi:hypothetical protein
MVCKYQLRELLSCFQTVQEKLNYSYISEAYICVL